MKRQQLIILFLLGTFLFNYPILSLFDLQSLLLGIPLLYLYLFAAWLILILLTAWFLEKQNH